MKDTGRKIIGIEIGDHIIIGPTNFKILQFKIVQETKLLTRVQVVPTDTLTDELKAQIIEGFKARLGSNVQITLEQVDAIAAEKSGKFRYVISKVEAA